MKFGAGDSAVAVNTPTRTALLRALRHRLMAGEGFALATLNLDHLTKLPQDADFLRAYKAQDFVVADGRPIGWLARLAGQRIEVIPGSELIVPLCALCTEMDLTVGMLGSSEAALAGAEMALVAQVPDLRIAYAHAPAYGFDPEGAEAQAVLMELAASGVALCFVALGAPKQEIFAARGRALAPEVGFASIGAGLDFLSGHQTRAPRIMRRLALEWLWRALQSPQRMMPRYAKCLAILPGLAWAAWQTRRGGA